MHYIQLNVDGGFSRVVGDGLHEWDANNYCTVDALVKDGKAEQFRVVPLARVDPPAFDPITQAVQALNPAKVGGVWTQRWSVVDLPAEQAAANLAAAKSATWDRIKAERDRRSAGGVKVGSNWFHSDSASRIQQIALVMLGANIPQGLQWKVLTLTPPPVFVTMTQTLASQVFAASIASDAAIFAAAEAHRIEMEKSDTPETYDFSGNWPLAIWEDV